MELSFFTLFIALLFSFLSPLVSAGKVTNPNKVPKDAILLSKVESLTLRAGRKTSSRRVSPVQQLTCVGPKDICNLYTIDVMRCTNEGSEYDKKNIQWSCRSQLPEEFKLGGTEVACEGYASSDDPYVLKGSCGVEYRLLLTDKGEEKYGRHSGIHNPDSTDGNGSRLGAILFGCVFALVLFIILKGLWDRARQNPPRLGGNDRRLPWHGGGGGGGGSGDDDDDRYDGPPPYDTHDFGAPPHKPKSISTRGYGTSGSSRTGGQQEQGWRPGPWTAGLAGAGLGYAFGRGNQTRTPTQPRSPPQRSGGFFGGGGNTAGPSTSGSSSPSFSSSRYESTGFGGTSRR